MQYSIAVNLCQYNYETVLQFRHYLAFLRRLPFSRGTAETFLAGTRCAAGLKRKIFLFLPKYAGVYFVNGEDLSDPSWQWIRGQGCIGGFTLHPAGFGKNRKSANGGAGRDRIASCPLWKGALGSSGVRHGPLQLPAQAAGLLGYLLSCLLPQRGYGFGKFKGGEQTIIVLPVNDDVIVRGQ